jgi:hypothetical protein
LFFQQKSEVITVDHSDLLTAKEQYGTVYQIIILAFLLSFNVSKVEVLFPLLLLGYQLELPNQNIKVSKTSNMTGKSWHKTHPFTLAVSTHLNPKSKIS